MTFARAGASAIAMADLPGVLGDLAMKLNIVAIMNNLALVLQRLGKYREAEHMHRQALKLAEKVLGKEHPDIRFITDGLFNVLDDQGKYNVGEQMCRYTFKLRQKVLGKEHSDTLSNLAYMPRLQGKHNEAEHTYRQALELREKVLGKINTDTLGCMNNLAVTLQ